MNEGATQDVPHPNTQERTTERRDYERRYERRFRRISVRLDDDLSEEFTRRLEEHDLTVNALLNALALGWARTSDSARAALAAKLHASPRSGRAGIEEVAQALEHLADTPNTH